jgi:hypothetical protein
MTWVVEEPLYIVILGVLTMAVLGFGWMQTRFRGLLYGICGTAVLMTVLLLVEGWVRTESEKIEALLHDLARYVEHNDADTILAHFHSEAVPSRERAASEMATYQFETVTIRRITAIEVDRGASPPQALASVRVYAEGSTRAAAALSVGVRRGSVTLDVEVTFCKESDQWRIFDYRRDDPFMGVKIHE